MLAPLRDYLRPRDPASSPLLCITKDRYFIRMSVSLDPNEPLFRESRWIVAEDVDVEHLLDIFTSTDANPEEVWSACAKFIQHLYWHKPRRTVLGQKIEDLPDNHRSKPGCLYQLTELFRSAGSYAKQKRLLNHTMELHRENGDDYRIARMLRELSDVNRELGLRKEGIQQAREALEICQRLSLTVDQVWCLNSLAFLLCEDKQLDASKEAVSHAIDLLPEEGHEYLVCQSQRILGGIYRSKGEREKAIHHFEAALTIASSFNWHDHLFWSNFTLAVLFLDEGAFDGANAHIEQARSHAVGHTYYLGCVMRRQATIWSRQRRLNEAKFEMLGALETHEKLGAARDVEDCRALLQEIEGATTSQSIPENPDSDGERIWIGRFFLLLLTSF